jgi:hypothetical protein
VANDEKRFWPYPKPDESLVGQSEALVHTLVGKMQADTAELTRAVLGHSGRGFMQVELSPDERDARMRNLLVEGTPEDWAGMLDEVKNDPKATTRLLKQWRDLTASQQGLGDGH